VVKLEYDTIRAEPGIAYFFFFGSIILGAYSLYQFTKPELPTLVPWIMLLGSIVIFLYAASVVFGSKTRYKVIVTLLDGSNVPIITANGEQAQGLLDSLTKALDWHRSGDILIDAERASHVRRSRASSSKGQGNGKEKSAANKASVENAPGEPAVEPGPVSSTQPGLVPAPSMSPGPHPSKVVRKLPPFIAAMLKGRD